MTDRSNIFKTGFGLQARMVFVWLLLGGIYAVLLSVVLSAGAGMLTAVVVMGGFMLAQLFLSDKIALRAMGARKVTEQEAPELHAMIARLSLQAGIAKPKVAVADTQIPNAFAMGRSQKSAVVCATTGIMGRLNEAELEGVMAHELAHVKNRDVLTMTVISFFSSIAMMLMQFSMFFGRGQDNGPSGAVIALVSFAVYAISFVLMMALSRYREFAADRGAAAITRQPRALASALQKISDSMETVPQRELRAAGEMNAFFIVPTRIRGAIGGLFTTHPPMEKRIARLVEYERALNEFVSPVPGDDSVRLTA